MLWRHDNTFGENKSLFECALLKHLYVCSQAIVNAGEFLALDVDARKEDVLVAAMSSAIEYQDAAAFLTNFRPHPSLPKKNALS